MTRLIAVLGLGAILAACQPESSSTQPTAEGAAGSGTLDDPAALLSDRDLFDALNAVGASSGIGEREISLPLLKAVVRQCSAGVVSTFGGDREVAICDFCFVDPTENPIGLPHGLGIRRHEVSATFAQAISHDRPEIRPTPGAPGVWVIDKDSLRENRPVQVVLASPDLAGRIGYVPVPPRAPPPNLAPSIARSGPVTEGMRQRLNQSVALRDEAAAVVQGCE